MISLLKLIRKIKKRRMKITSSRGDVSPVGHKFEIENCSGAVHYKWSQVNIHKIPLNNHFSQREVLASLLGAITASPPF